MGITSALQKIKIDRYSQISETGVSVAFLDTLNTFKGCKSVLDKQHAWIRYNTVEFGSVKFKSVQVKVLSQTGGILQIRLDKADGLKFQKGIHNLVVVLKDNNPVEVDWIQFKN